MAGEWSVQTFADLVGGRENIIGGPFGSNLTQADYVSNGVPVIRGSNMEQAGRYIGGDFAYVSLEKAIRLRSNQIERGDIVVTQRGTMGQVSIVPAELAPRYIVSQSQMGVRVTNSDPLFIYYLLRSPRFLSFLDGATIQTGVPHINMGLLRAWEVAAPAVREQRRISRLLGSLDDKIELNRRIAETLEAMARALFKSWFVDFDPVHAKVEGRPAGLPDGVAALFPDSFGEGGLPEGWIWGTVADLAAVNPTTPLKTEAAPYIDMAALPTSGPRVARVLQRAPGSGARFKNDDTLIARITPCLENGKTALVDCLDGDAVGWGSTEFIVLRPNADTPRALPYLLARHQPFREALIAAMSGTSGRQRVQADAVIRWSVAIPKKPVLRAFENITSPIFRRITRLGDENATLADLRDTLLPKLISGALHIADAEKKVSAA